MKKRTKILLYGLIGFFGLSAIWYGRNLREADDTDQRGESHFTEDRTEPDTDAAEVSTTSSKETGTEPGGHFVLSQVSSYAGKPYVTVNDDKPFFSDKEKSSTVTFETYSEMDSLGRCGTAFANLDRELMPEEERGQIGQIRPSGWHTVKYNDLIDGNYLYNRCHLIAYALTGQNANELNLITGTRYFNTELMLPYELRVARFLDHNDDHVLYRVTPYFRDDELVARGVEMEAFSVEDNGEGVCFHVFCYNVQPGIEIDYETGENREIQNEEVR